MDHPPDALPHLGASSSSGSINHAASKSSSLFGSPDHSTPSGNRFAATSNAFGLTISPASSSSPSSVPGPGTGGGSGSGNGREHLPPHFSSGEISPTTASKKQRLRRPSMLSLTQTPVMDHEGSPPGISPTSPTAFPSPGRARPNASSSAGTGATIGVATLAPAASPSPNPFLQALHPKPTPKWTSSFLLSGDMQRTSSGPGLPFEGLSTTTPPIPSTTALDDPSTSGSQSPMELETRPSAFGWKRSPLPSSSFGARGLPDSDLNLDGDLDIGGPPPPARPPFSGKPLPAPLLATLISESAPAEHEMRSEARLQRLLASHPARFPFTPRPSRGSRGRFPEMVGGDDDDDDDILMSTRRSSAWNPRGWFPRAASSDSDDDDIMDDLGMPEGVPGAFAAGMDLERPSSSGSMAPAGWANNGHGNGGAEGGSGKSTPGHQSVAAPRNGGGSGEGSAHHPTPPLAGTQWSDRFKASRMSFGNAAAGMLPSPGGGLPGAFGSLGMGNITPLTSPTVEKLELATSPGTVSVASPSLMQYRDGSSGGGYRPGKRKAAAEDRYDPYKRPRGVSPALSNAGSVASMMSPSRNSPAIPIPSSPSHSAAMYYPSTLSSSNPMRSRAHYTRPMASRSRQASPALSIGSASGVISTSLGAGAGSSTHRGSFAVQAPLGGTFVPAGGGGGKPGGGPDLGGLGLLSLQGASGVGETVEEEEGDEVELAEERTEVSSGMSRNNSSRSGSGGTGEGEADEVEGMEMD